MKGRSVFALVVLFLLLTGAALAGRSYRWIASLGHLGEKPGELNGPYDVAVGPDEDLYITDANNHRVQKSTADGMFLLQWGEQNKVNNIRSALNFLWNEDLEGKFYFPAKIAVGPNDEIYVSDSYNNRVQVFSPDGIFLRKWGGMGLWGGRFRVASDIAFDRDDDPFCHRDRGWNPLFPDWGPVDLWFLNRLGNRLWVGHLALHAVHWAPNHQSGHGGDAYLLFAIEHAVFGGVLGIYPAFLPSQAESQERQARRERFAA